VINIVNNPLVRKNIAIAWPIALNGLLMQSMLIIDTLLVSPLGELPLAGMGIATTIVAFILGIQIALSNGTQLVIGRAFGAGSDESLAMSLFGGLVINLLVAVVFLCCIKFFSTSLISLLTNDLTLIAHIETYLEVSQYIILITGLTQVFTAFFNGKGSSNIPLKGYFIELPFNAIISYLLIFGFNLSGKTLSPSLDFINVSFSGMGLAGAALGSLLAVFLRLGYLLWQIHKSKIFNSFNSTFNVVVNECKKHFNEIYPVAANFTVLSIGNTVYLLLFSQLNLYSYVAVTLIFPWIRIGTQFITSWAQASAILISQAIGKRQQHEIKKIISSSISVGLFVAVCIGIAFYILSLSIEIIYPEVESQTYIALASIAPLYILLPFVRSYNTIAGNTLRALGESIKVLKIHFVTQWVIVLPVCALMIFYFELPLYWAFSMLVFEEMIKAVPFYKLLKTVRK
jgi:Na+-driven multidrug efflux pump